MDIFYNNMFVPISMNAIMWGQTKDSIRNNNIGSAFNAPMCSSIEKKFHHSGLTTAKSPPPHGQALSPHKTDARVWRAARRANAYNQTPLQKNRGTAVRSTALRAYSDRTPLGKKGQNIWTKASEHAPWPLPNPNQNRNKGILCCVLLSQIFEDIIFFFTKNCDKKVTNLCSEKKSPS